jgi:dienelactone hydrolase
MGKSHRSSRDRALSVEGCEERVLTTLVFVLNGNAFSAATPGILTSNAAHVLRRAGDHAVQLAYPTIATAGAFYGLEQQIKSLSHGQPIGIVGFSAGGSLALRIATDKGLHVVAVLDYYGPPDLKAWLHYHGNDRFARYVREHVPFTRAAMNLFSGSIATNAHVVAAFGLRDHNVVASVSEASFKRDLPDASLYTYDGGHGVGIETSRPALQEFLASL